MILNLFSGADGWGVGARPLGLDPIGFELDEWACATARAAGHRVVRQDVTTLSLAHLRGKVHGLIASPPCTDFSMAGKRNGIDGDTGRLIFEVPRLVAECEPEWIACEQVPSVLPWWRQFARDFTGYSTWCGVLNSADYGVPQTRERAILIASRVRDVAPPPPTHAEHPHPTMSGDDELPWVSMAEALGWGDITGSGGGGGQKFRHAVMRNGSQKYATEGRADEPAPTILGSTDNGDTRWYLDTHRDQREDGSTQTRTLSAPAPAVTGKASGQWAFERPSTTVMGDSRVWAPGHHANAADGPDKSRNDGAIKVTLTEFAVLQSFPADYPFQGTKSARSLQIGNAIPPLLAQHVLRAAAAPARERENRP